MRRDLRRRNFKFSVNRCESVPFHVKIGRIQQFLLIQFPYDDYTVFVYRSHIIFISGYIDNRTIVILFPIEKRYFAVKISQTE